MFDFDFEVEVADKEKDIFVNPSQMETIFNYADLSFQLFTALLNETYTIVARQISD